MALVLKDRVLETCSAPGTGAVTLLGAVTGYQAFSTVGNGNTCYYAIADQSGSNWEVGIGTYATSGNTLTRTTILSSSNAGSTVNFATGTQNVFLTYPSERSVNLSSAALTSGRVTYATTDGLLTDSANMTFNGTTLTLANDASISGLTVGTGNTVNSSNTAFGSSALLVNTNFYNTAIGGNALIANTSGGYNTGIGYQPLRFNTTGSSNTAVGLQSLFSNTTASNNTAVGYQAGYSNTTAGSNTYVGYQTGLYQTGSNNSAFGINAFQGVSGSSTGINNCAFGGTDSVVGVTLASNTTGGQNNAFGNGALGKNSSGSSNSAFGHQALSSNTTASYNTAVGYQAGYSNTTGTELTAVGYQALKNNTGSANSAVGLQALFFNTSGNNNTAFGDATLLNNTTASNNTAVGYQAGYTNTTGTSITAVGYQALYNNTAPYLTAVGYRALYSNTTGGGNVAVGLEALFANTTGNSNVAFGGYDGGSVNAALRNNTTGSSNSAFGVGALQANTTASNNTAVGYQAGYSNTTGQGIVALGYKAAYATTVDQNTAIGDRSLTANTTGLYNTALGAISLFSNTTGANNTALGYYTLFSNTTASNNTAVGYQAGYSNTTGAQNLSAGVLSLYANTTGAENVAIGSGAVGVVVGALGSNTTGNYNTAIGNQALKANTTASNNTAVGYQAGYSNTTNGGNLFLGYQAGYGATGVANTLIGAQAGYNLTTGTYNTFVGQGSTGGTGTAVTTGSKNTILGGYTGYQGGLDIRTASNYIVLSDGDGNPRQVIDSSGNVLIGSTTNFASSKLYVDNSITTNFDGVIGMRYNVSGQTNSYYKGMTGLSITDNVARGLHIFNYDADSNQGIRFYPASYSGQTANPAVIIDSSGNVGIGTSSPTQKLDVVAGGGYIARFYGDASNYLRIYNGSGYQILESNGANQFGYINTAFFVQTGSGTEAMRIDTSGNVGIGTSSPNGKLDVASGNVFITQDYELNWHASGTKRSQLIGDSSNNLKFSNRVGGVLTETMRLDSSGNLGLGVTPSAWSGLKAFEFAGVGSSLASASNNNLFLSANAWYNGTNWRYGITSAASQYQSFNGQHVWNIAPSGTAGNAITFTQAMTLDNSGNLLVGTSSLATGFSSFAQIEASGTTGGVLINSATSNIGRLIFTNNNTSGNEGLIRYDGSNQTMQFWTSAAERMRIDSSGNLGLGVTPSAWGSTRTAIQNSLGASWQGSTGTYSFSDFGANFYFNGTNELYIGSDYATKYRQLSGTHQWYTAPSGTAGNAVTFTQAMTLNASGQWLLNTTSPIYSNADAAHIYAKISSSNQYGLMIGGDASAYTCYAARFLTNNSGNVVGSITFSTTSTLYNVTSDQRLKENIIDAPDFGSVIDSLKVRSFDWKIEGIHQRAGFVAQELVSVAPEAVHQPTNPEDMMSVDYSKLVPMLVKEIQSLRKRLAAAGI